MPAEDFNPPPNQNPDRNQNQPDNLGTERVTGTVPHTPSGITSAYEGYDGALSDIKRGAGSAELTDTDAGKRRITQGDPCGHQTQDTSPTEQLKPDVRSGAGVDIDSARMPADGVLEVHDSDDEILDEEKRHPISRNGLGGG